MSVYNENNEFKMVMIFLSATFVLRTNVGGLQLHMAALKLMSFVCVYVCMSVPMDYCKSPWVLSFEILAMGFLGVHNSKMNVSKLGDS